MGIYQRADSPFWWMAIERVQQKPLRVSTGIAIDGGSPAQNKALAVAAKQVYATTKAQHVLGTVTVQKPIISFRGYAKWYADNKVLHRRGAIRDRSILRQLALSFGHLESLTAFDAHMVEEWMTARRKLGKQPGTVNRELDVLKAMLACAVPKYLERNPIAGVRRFRVPEKEPRVLTPDEEARLLKVATEEEAAVLVLAIDTLLRLSSVVNLKWAQVKAADIVPLNAKVSLDTVPISRRLRDALAELPKGEEWVFPSFHHGKGETAAKNALIRTFDALCQKAGLPHGRAAGGLTFHCLRHTGATRALQRGASVRTVMKLGGWKAERMVMRYSHASDQDVRDAADTIGGGRAIPFTSRSRGHKRG